MSLIQLVNSHPDSIWESEENTYVAYIPVPGVYNIDVMQNGKVLKIRGSNPQLKVSYAYDLSLHPDSTDTPSVRIEAGMVVVISDKASNLKKHIIQSIPIIPPPSG